MTVHQISVFVENKSGTLVKVLDLFKDAGYARYRLNRFCSPELHLTETPPEALAPVE